MPKRAASQTSQNHTTMDSDRQRTSAGVTGQFPAAFTPRWRSSMVEQLICNQQVAGSIPIASSLLQSNVIAWAEAGSARRSPSRESLRTLPGFSRIIGRVPEWPKGTDCKSVVSDFEGSNPSPSTSVFSSGSFGDFGSFAWAEAGFARRSPSRESLRTISGFSWTIAGVAQLVELQPSKLDVAGSRPVSRSIPMNLAHVAQLAEHVLGKDEVTRSIRVVGSRAAA